MLKGFFYFLKMFWQHCEIVTCFKTFWYHCEILASENTKNEIGNSNDQLLIELKN